jgi:FKBP-type peptidyl-prolyl cis-trans isomerase (trigger factor)
MPEIKLPDYKKIAVKEGKEKVEPTEATDKELEETIDEIRKNYAMKNHTHAEGEEHKPDEKLDLPEVNEEWVKKLGAFATVEDFKNRIKESLSFFNLFFREIFGVIC